MASRSLAPWLAVLCAVQAPAAAAQTLGQAPPDDVSWLRVGLALLLSIGLAVAGAWALRHRLRGGQLFLGRPAAPRRLEVVETVRLSHQVDVSLLQCDGRHYLVAASPHGATLIAEHQLPATPAARKLKSRAATTETAPASGAAS